MPPALDPGDRKLLLIGGAILLQLIVADGYILRPPQTMKKARELPRHIRMRITEPKPPIFCSASLGYKLERWENPHWSWPLTPKEKF